MKNSLKLIEKNPDSTPEQKLLLTLKDHPIEVYDTEGVEKIIRVVRSLNVIEAEVIDKQ